MVWNTAGRYKKYMKINQSQKEEKSIVREMYEMQNQYKITGLT